MANLRMPEINQVMLSGNLTKDPIRRYTASGTPVVNFSIASNRKFRDKNRQWKEDVCFIGIVAWNQLAESCYKSLSKGSAVLIEGELQSRNFDTEDGGYRSVIEVKARKIQFLNSNSKDLLAFEEDEMEYEEA